MRPEQRSGLGLLGALMGALIVSASSATAAPVSCSAFKAAFIKLTPELKSSFVRPLIVSKGGPINEDLFDLVTNSKIDGTLRCRGETLRRFTATISVPADASLSKSFGRLQRAALTAAFAWPPARARSTAQKINAEASEYLKASVQRGDIVVSGKTEHHEVGGDLGMLWTPRERTFVIVGQDVSGPQ